MPDDERRPDVIMLPGGVLPASLAYEALLKDLGDAVNAATKELEVYAGEAPPPGFTLEVEVAGILRYAEEVDFERFHLVGYSGGGASSLAFAAAHPERLRVWRCSNPRGQETRTSAQRRPPCGASSTGSRSSRPAR